MHRCRYRSGKHYLNPSVNLGNDTAFCGTGSYTIHASLSGATYTWQNGSTADSIIATSSGTYSVTVTLSTCSSSGSVNVAFNPLPSVAFTNDTTVCTGQTVTLNAGNTGSAYLWSTGATNQSINVNASGNFAVTVTDQATCTATGSETVSIVPAITSNATVTNIVCTSFSNAVITPGSSLGPLVYTLIVTGAANDSGIFNHLSPGTYLYTITDTIGCMATDSFVISPQPVDNFNLTVLPTSCFGYNDGSVVVNTLASYNPPFHYSINSGPMLTDSIFDSLSAGQYDIAITNAIGCSYFDTAVITQPAPVSVTFAPDTILTFSNTATAQSQYRQFS